MSVAAPIPFLFTIDVEPDVAVPDRSARDPWRGFERMAEIVDELRPVMARATGHPMHVVWVLRADHQVELLYGSPGWALEHYRGTLERLRAAGDALGIHPHAWRWRDDQPGGWIEDHGDAAFVEHVLRRSAAAFEAEQGPCTIHRFGSRFLSPAIIRTVRELGFRYDMTLEPGGNAMKALGPHPATGLIPDQTQVPRIPYRPDPRDPTRATTTVADAPRGAGTDDDLWMIPHTAFDPDTLLPAWKRVARRIRYPGRPLHRPVQLFAPVRTEGFWDLLARETDALAAPYLSLALRSEVPFRPFWPVIEERLRRFVSHPLAARVAFSTPDEAMDLLRGRAA